MCGRKKIEACFLLLVLGLFSPIWVPIVLIYGGCFLSKKTRKRSDEDDEKNIDFWCK